MAEAIDRLAWRTIKVTLFLALCLVCAFLASATYFYAQDHRIPHGPVLDRNAVWTQADKDALRDLYSGIKFISSNTAIKCVNGKVINFYADGTNENSGTDCWR